jgi:hypothetical protein
VCTGNTLTEVTDVVVLDTVVVVLDTLVVVDEMLVVVCMHAPQRDGGD